MRSPLSGLEWSHYGCGGETLDRSGSGRVVYRGGWRLSRRERACGCVVGVNQRGLEKRMFGAR